MDNMTVFGWFTISLWGWLTIAKGTEPALARALSLFMIIGTLVWGTGSF